MGAGWTTTPVVGAHAGLFPDHVRWQHLGLLH
jgi:hypothetical protein